MTDDLSILISETDPAKVSDEQATMPLAAYVTCTRTSRQALLTAGKLTVATPLVSAAVTA